MVSPLIDSGSGNPYTVTHAQGIGRPADPQVKMASQSARVVSWHPTASVKSALHRISCTFWAGSSIMGTTENKKTSSVLDTPADSYDSYALEQAVILPSRSGMMLNV